LEDTILQLDNDLTSCRFQLSLQTDQCSELRQENQELKIVIKSTTDCLEELHHLKSQQTQPSSPAITSQQQLQQQQQQQQQQLLSQAQAHDQDILTLKEGYESKVRQLQESIDHLRSENQTLRAKIETSSFPPSSSSSSFPSSISDDPNDLRGHSPVNLSSKMKPKETNGNSFQRKNPPLSARRLRQTSSADYGEPLSSAPERQQVLSQQPKDSRMSFSSSGKVDTRRHSSYTTGDYVVSYAMKQTPTEGAGTEIGAAAAVNSPKPLSDPIIASKKSPQSSRDILLTHPYYPHSAAASSLWQDAIAQEVPLPSPSLPSRLLWLLETFRSHSRRGDFEADQAAYPKESK
jgi:hypothetical protein